jgi:glycosyltransferase involved in cell wall biosynthesis
MYEVSYIITVYNKAQCLEGVIHSLKNQAGEIDSEYIFVDDGSTDNSFETLHTLCLGLPNAIITSQQNQGPSVAINTGLKLATKKWVYLGDGDDYIYPDATITLLRLAEKYDSKMCHGGHSNDPKNDKRLFDQSVAVYNDALKKALSFYPCGVRCIIDRELMLQVLGCDERVFIQDYSIALRISQYTKFVVANQIISYNVDMKQERLSGSKLQENHDTAAARYLFVKDHMDIEYKYKFLALQKQMAKAWSWYKKQRIIPRFWSKYFLRYIFSKFDLSFSDEVIELWMRESLEVYDKSKLRAGYCDVDSVFYNNNNFTNP